MHGMIPNGMMVVPGHKASIPNVASSNNLSDTTSVRQNKTETKSKKGPSKSPRGRSASITASVNESVISDGGGDDDDDDDDDDDGGNGDVSSRLTRNQREQKRYVDPSLSFRSHTRQASFHMLVLEYWK